MPTEASRLLYLSLFGKAACEARLMDELVTCLSSPAARDSVVHRCRTDATGLTKQITYLLAGLEFEG